MCTDTFWRSNFYKTEGHLRIAYSVCRYLGTRNAWEKYRRRCSHAKESDKMAGAKFQTYHWLFFLQWYYTFLTQNLSLDDPKQHNVNTAGAKRPWKPSAHIPLPQTIGEEYAELRLETIYIFLSLFWAWMNCTAASLSPCMMYAQWRRWSPSSAEMANANFPWAELSSISLFREDGVHTLDHNEVISGSLLYEKPLQKVGNTSETPFLQVHKYIVSSIMCLSSKGN
jgi:hypothetical protein